MSAHGARAKRALAVVLVWVALLMVGSYALGVATGWLLWPSLENMP